MISEEAFHRLSKTVVPSHYEIRIVPNLDAFTFGGKVKIDLKVSDLLFIERNSITQMPSD